MCFILLNFMITYIHCCIILSMCFIGESRKRKIEEVEEDEKVEGENNESEKGVEEEVEDENDEEKEDEDDDDDEKDEEEGNPHSLSIYPENMDLQNADLQNMENMQNTEMKIDTTVMSSHLDAKARKELKMHNKRAKSLDDGISVYCVPVNTVLKWRYNLRISYSHHFTFKNVSHFHTRNISYVHTYAPLHILLTVHFTIVRSRGKKGAELEYLLGCGLHSTDEEQARMIKVRGERAG
jgi:hypothetical protein